jgi:membrane protease YdiL (CAAX protease family)
MDQAAKPRWRRIVDFPLVALVICLAFVVLANVIVFAVGRALPPMPREAKVTIQAAQVIVLLALVYKLVCARIGEKPRDELKLAGSSRELGQGVLVGTLIFSLVVGIAALFDVYNIVGPGSSAGLYIALISTAVVPGFAEELVFRGILFRWIEEFAGSWFALAFTSALFGLAHIMNPNATAFSSFAIAVEAGILLGGAYMLTRSLWLPIGIHAAWNFTQGSIFDVNVSGTNAEGLVTAELSGPELLSGGAFGLEASIIALVIATAFGLWYLVRAINAGHLVRPWWVRRRLARQQQPE